jgi:hypothetical protein
MDDILEIYGVQSMMILTVISLLKKLELMKTFAGFKGY